MMHLAGEVTAKDCPRALSSLKQLAERGRLAGGSVQAGHEAFFAGHYTEVRSAGVGWGCCGRWF